MPHPVTRLAVAVATAAMGLAALTTASASATTPSFDRCPRTTPGLLGCVDVQATDGSIAADNHRLPLAGAHIRIEGGLDANLAFVPPASGDALTASPVDVPGGLFGTNLPYNLNSVKATVEQAGPISYDYFASTVTAPIRIRFTNPLLGTHCVIGSATSPITLTLITGTTNPAAPNAPISGVLGTIESVPGTVVAFIGQVQVDNAFAVPAATGCGIVAQTQVTKAINKNLGLPSAAGHYNDATLTLDHYIATA
jgi:hypothetical protein